MTRRRFAFWIGMGLFGLSERLGASELDAVAAKLMEASDPPADPPWPILPDDAPATEMPVHWQTTHNRTWRWVQREHYVDGVWVVTGMTTPVRRDSGESFEGAEGYLQDSDVPEAYRLAFDEVLDANGESIAPQHDEGVSTIDDAPGPDAADHRRARHGRPPSRWLRSLRAAELSVWLANLEPPEAGVKGMSFFEHLTRDHAFLAERIEGLTEPELEKLHGAAHHGY